MIEVKTVNDSEPQQESMAIRNNKIVNNPEKIIIRKVMTTGVTQIRKVVR